MLADKSPDPTSFFPLQLTKHQFFDIFSKTNIGCMKNCFITNKFHISENVERCHCYLTSMKMLKGIVGAFPISTTRCLCLCKISLPMAFIDDYMLHTPQIKK
jgi:hypothetical protein